MRPYDVTYFLDDGENLTCHMGRGTYYDGIIINNESEYSHATPHVIFYVPIKDEQTFINFKNSVVWAFNAYMRTKHETTNPNKETNRAA